MTNDGCNFYFSFWAIFCPLFCSANSLKNQKLRKMHKTPGYIIILHMCTKNYGQMMAIIPEIWCATDGGMD